MFTCILEIPLTKANLNYATYLINKALMIMS